jgi:hypothetical protein
MGVYGVGDLMSVDEVVVVGLAAEMHSRIYLR